MSGVAEYLFRSRDRIEKAINAGLNDKVFRADDLEFTVAARQWGECVSFGNFDLYERRFMDTASECGCVGFLSASASTCFHCLVCPLLPLLSVATPPLIMRASNFFEVCSVPHCFRHSSLNCLCHSGGQAPPAGVAGTRLCVPAVGCHSAAASQAVPAPEQASLQQV